MSRTLGIDYGYKRIGLALSDPSKMIAGGIETMATARRLQLTVKALAKVVEANDVDKIVVGFPYKLNGSYGPLCDEINQLIDQLREATGVEVVAWDERMTTVCAERALREANMRRKKRAKVVDKVAAVLILQSYLDSQ